MPELLMLHHFHPKMLPTATNACVAAVRRQWVANVNVLAALPYWGQKHATQQRLFVRFSSSVTSTLTNSGEVATARPARRSLRRTGVLPPSDVESFELPDLKASQRLDTRGQVVDHPETLQSRRSSLPKDMLMERITTAGTVEEVLTVLDRHLEVMNDLQAAVSVKRMRDFLHDLPPNELRRIVQSICSHPAFRLLCDRLYDRAYLMGGDTTVVILDFLRWCNVSMRTRVAQVYLNMLRQHIQTMDINDLFTAHYVLEKLPRVAVVDAMLTALPIACELRYDTEIDPDYLPGLLHALNYFGRIGMSEAAKMKLANSLVHHTPHFTIDDAVTALRFARGLPAGEERLLRFCTEMVTSEGLVSTRHRAFSTGQLQKLLDNVKERGLLSIRLVQRVIEYCKNLKSPMDHLKLAIELGDLKIFDFKMLDRVADDIVNDLSLIETKWISHKQMRIIRMFANAAYKPKNGNTMLDLLIGSSVSTLESGEFLSNNLELLLTIQYCLVLRHWPSGLVNRLFSEPFFGELLKQFPADGAGTPRDGGGIDSSLRMMLALRSVVQIIDTVYPQHASMVPEKARDSLRRCTDWLRAYRYISLEKNLHAFASRDVTPAENAVVHGVVDRYGCCFDYGMIVNSRSKACVDVVLRMREQPGGSRIAGSSARVNTAARDGSACVMYELEALQNQLRGDEKLVVISIRGSPAYCVSHENRMLGVYLAQNESLKLRGLAPINIRTDHWDQLSPHEQRLFVKRLVSDAVSNEDTVRDAYTVDVSLSHEDNNKQFDIKS